MRRAEYEAITGNDMKADIVEIDMWVFMSGRQRDEYERDILEICYQVCQCFSKVGLMKVVRK